MIQRNKYTLRGTYLGIVYDCGLRALSEFHKLGVLHRDLTPDNMLITSTGDVIIMDVSFSCRKESQQRPVFNRAFSPPEQRDGKAVEQSDWYSFVSSSYFLANGVSPLACDPNTVTTGIYNINLGAFYHRDPEREEVIAALLEQDVKRHPSSYRDILFRTGTLAKCVDVYGVLDLDELGFMILYPDAFTIGSRVAISRELQHKLQTSNVPDGLRMDAKVFADGGNPWLKE